MSRQRTPINSRKGIKISRNTQDLYENRDRKLDKEAETRPLSPERWAQAMRREEFFRVTMKET